jgi:hypothetical protein
LSHPIFIIKISWYSQMILIPCIPVLNSVVSKNNENIYCLVIYLYTIPFHCYNRSSDLVRNIIYNFIVHQIFKFISSVNNSSAVFGCIYYIFVWFTHNRKFCQSSANIIRSAIDLESSFSLNSKFLNLYALYIIYIEIVLWFFLLIVSSWFWINSIIK